MVTIYGLDYGYGLDLDYGNGYGLDYEVGNVQAFIDEFKNTKYKKIKKTINKGKRNEK